jgi:hypothetical protein
VWAEHVARIEEIQKPMENVGGRSSKENNHLGDISVDGNTILK